jgi:hypothetical protein
MAERRLRIEDRGSKKQRSRIEGRGRGKGEEKNKEPSTKNQELKTR